MTLTVAKALRDYIRSKDYHCIVPLGFGPSGYFARIFSDKPIDFDTMKAFRAHHAKRLRERRRIHREYQHVLRRRARSPIEIMIDRACGLD